MGFKRLYEMGILQFAWHWAYGESIGWRFSLGKMVVSDTGYAAAVPTYSIQILIPGHL